MNQGAAANKSGATAEDIIAAVLTQRAIRFTRQAHMGASVYGTPMRVDFYLPDVFPHRGGLVIESKWQAAQGSVDEKLPYLVENIRHCLRCPAIIVIDGDGFRAGAVAWLREQVDDHLIAVQTIAQFVTWAQRLKL
jgi:hypothetical protein